MINSTSIEFVTLVVTIITGLVLPFAQVPFIGYEEVTSSQSKTNELAIRIHNYGLTTAHDIILSVDVGSTKIINATSKPFLSESFKIVNNTSADKNKTVQITVLPPQAEMIVYFQINKTTSLSTTNQQPTVYLWSNEVIGHPVMYVYSIFLIVFGLAVVSSRYFIKSLKI